MSYKKGHIVTEETKRKAVATRKARGSYFCSESTKAQLSRDRKGINFAPQNNFPKGENMNKMSTPKTTVDSKKGELYGLCIRK